MKRRLPEPPDPSHARGATLSGIVGRRPGGEAGSSAPTASPLRWLRYMTVTIAARLCSIQPMDRQAFLRRLFFALRVSFIVLWWPREVSAHAPHDEVSALVLSPHYFYDGIAFAIVRYNILRSTDFGCTWRRLARGLRRCTFRDSAISPSFAAGRCVFASSPEAGIFRSRDAGLSWVSLSDTLPDRQIEFLAISPLFQSDRQLLATGRDGQLYMTNDAGDHWRRCFGEDGRRVSAAVVVRSSIVVGTSAGSIHRSDDGGGQWRVLARLQAHQPITCFAAVDDAASTLLVGTGSGCVALTDAKTGSETRSAGLAGRHITSLLSTQHADGHPILFASTWRAALFHSSDVGRSWRQYGAGLTTEGQADEFRLPHFRGIAASATFPADQTLFLAGFDGVFKSTDGGTSWREMREALSAGLIVALDVAQADDTTLRVAASTYVAGVYFRSGEGPWDVGNVGLDGGRLSDVAFSPGYAADRTVFALGNWSLFKSVDGGLSWDSTRLVGAPRTVHQLKARVFSSLRGIVPMLMRMWGRERVLRWKHWFAWLAMRVGEPLTGPGWGAVLAVCPDFGTSRRLFIGGPAGVLRSLDGGRSFDSVLERAGAPVRALVASPDFARDGTIFAAFDEQLFRSVDRGSTWEPLFDGQGMAFPRLAVSPAYRRDSTRLRWRRVGALAVRRWWKELAAAPACHFRCERLR